MYEALLDLWKSVINKYVAPTCLNTEKSYQETSLHSFCLHWMPHFSFERSRKAQKQLAVNCNFVSVTGYATSRELSMCIRSSLTEIQQPVEQRVQKLNSSWTYSDVGYTQLTTITFCKTLTIIHIYIRIYFKAIEQHV